MPTRHPTVYLHIGPPKTGTTYLQDVLWRNRKRLSRLDIALPDRSPTAHFQAALDLRAMEFAGHHDRAVRGAWQRLVAKCQSAGSDKVIITHELFAGASQEQIERVAADLAPAPIHVIYGARDVARQLPAVWQETLKNRRTSSFRQFLSTTLKVDQSGRRTGGFWQAHDPVEVLNRWGCVVRPNRIHVVTLPQRGAPPSTLWARFCEAVEMPPGGFDLEVARSNSSLTAPYAEVLRRLNTVLPAGLPWPSYERLVKNRFSEYADTADTMAAGEPLVVPEQDHATVMQIATEMRGGLAAAGYHIVGDLGDLIPPDSAFGRMIKPSPDKVIEAAVQLLSDALTADDGGLRVRAVAWAHAIRRR
ncbi:MAG: hypothetical protein ACR2KG_10985 [Nocardioidaceae bacterium]